MSVVLFASSVNAQDLLPPDSSEAAEMLRASKTQGEWVEIGRDGETPLRTWVVYPGAGKLAPAVVLIHGIRGLNDWTRAAALQVAASGYVALAPDLVSGMGPEGGGFASMPTRDEVGLAMRKLTGAQIHAAIDAVRQHALTVSNGKTATIGFCWGGGESFRYAVNQPALDAAILFYGTSPETSTLARIRAPVLGLYGGDDERVNATIPDADAEMKRLGKVYEQEIYEGAGHAFLSRQAERDGANQRATEKGWTRAMAFLERYLR